MLTWPSPGPNESGSTCRPKSPGSRISLPGSRAQEEEEEEEAKRNEASSSAHRSRIVMLYGESTLFTCAISPVREQIKTESAETTTGQLCLVSHYGG